MAEVEGGTVSLTAAHLVCKQSIRSRQRRRRRRHECGGCKQIILLTTIKRNSQRVKNPVPPSPPMQIKRKYMCTGNQREKVRGRGVKCHLRVIAFTCLVLAHCPHFTDNCINLLFALFCLPFSLSLSLTSLSFCFLQSPAEWRRCGWLRWRQWRRRWPVAQRQPQIAAAIVKVAHAARHHFARTSGRLAAHG